VAALAFCACRTRLSQRSLTRSVLVLVAIDLAIVAWPVVATVDRAEEAGWMAAAPHQFPIDSGVSDERQAATALPAMAQPATAEPPWVQRALRFAPGGDWLPAWRTTPSAGAQRMLAVEASQRNSRYGRWHLMHERAVFNPVSSLPPHRVHSFWRAA